MSAIDLFERRPQNKGVSPRKRPGAANSTGRRFPGTILGRDFYARHPTRVARDLLGKVLVRTIGRTVLAGRIVETEAYSSDDPASHAFRGPTERNRALFGEPGHAYIYLSHGRYNCLNVVARKGRPAGGVLIRGIEVLAGIGAGSEAGSGRGLPALVSGPGNLTRAMRIGLDLYGTDMTRPEPLTISGGGSNEVKFRRTSRIGVTAGQDKLWRYVAVRTAPRPAQEPSGPAHRRR